MYIFYLLIIASIFLLSYKVTTNGLNLLRFNFAIYIIISLIPFSLLYYDHFHDITSYFAYKVFFSLFFIFLILIDNTKIKLDYYSRLDFQIINIIGYFSIFIIFTFVLLTGINNFPLFNIISGSYTELILMREDSYKNADISDILYYLIFYVKYFFIPLYTSSIIVYWKKLNHKLVYVTLFIMTVNQLLTLSKTAFFLMVLSGILTNLYMTKITIKKIFLSIIILTLIPIIILYIMVSDREFLVTLGALGNRMFLIPEDSALYYYELYLNDEFKNFTSSTLFALFNSKEVINIQNFVFLKMTSNVILKDGTAPGNIFGIAYVDFNEFLIPFYHMFILGFIFWLNKFMINYHSYFSISFFVSASIALSFIYFTNFPTVINSYGVLFVILFLLFLRSKRRKHSNKLNTFRVSEELDT